MDKITIVGNPMTLNEFYQMIRRVEKAKSEGEPIENILSKETLSNILSEQTKYDQKPIE